MDQSALNAETTETILAAYPIAFLLALGGGDMEVAKALVRAHVEFYNPATSSELIFVRMLIGFRAAARETVEYAVKTGASVRKLRAAQRLAANLDETADHFHSVMLRIAAERLRFAEPMPTSKPVPTAPPKPAPPPSPRPPAQPKAAAADGMEAIIKCFHADLCPRGRVH